MNKKPHKGGTSCIRPRLLLNMSTDCRQAATVPRLAESLCEVIRGYIAGHEANTYSERVAKLLHNRRLTQQTCTEPGYGTDDYTDLKYHGKN